MVVSSNEPLLFLSRDLTVIATSTSFCRNFEIDPASVPGRRLANLEAASGRCLKLESLLMATALGSARTQAHEVDLKRPNRLARQLIVNAHAR
jgi:hypothetical protein